MDKKIKVSVIIPIYNAEKYVKECLDSLLNQTLREIEIICVNDGSTDGSQAVLEDYAKKDARIKVIQQKNSYAGVARNNGMKHAQGEYLLFLDADDFFEPEMIEGMYNKAVLDTADICICNARAYSETEQTFQDFTHYYKEDILPEIVPFSPKDINQFLFQFTIPAPWNKLFKKSFVEKQKITFDELKRANDLYFTYLAMATAEKITTINERYINYRTDLNSSLQGTNSVGTFEFIEALMHLKTELKNRKLWHRYEKSFINRALDTCLFNLNKAGSKEAYILLYDKLKYESFYDLGITIHTKGNFYIKHHYSSLAEMTVKTAEESWDKLQLKQDEAPYETISEWVKLYIEDDEESVKVSVIIPVYNVEDYLGECLESVINQTLKDIEIICVNDGSQDGSVDIVKKYEAHDARIKLINKENGGLSSARNAGMKEVSGEYVVFLDSDDFLETYALEYLYYEAKKDHLDQLFFSSSIFYEGCETVIKDDYYIRKNDYSEVVSGQELFAKWVENAEFKPSACLQINRTGFLRENQLSFKEGIIHEDNLFTIQCLYYSKKVRYANINLYNRRVHEDSIMTGGQHFKHAYHLYLVVMELKKFAQEQNLCKSKLYYDALIVQSERILIQAAYYAKSLSDEEIRDCVYNMEEEDAFNFYMCVCSLAKARGTMTRLWERTKNSEDNFRVLRFRSRMQRELLEKEIADLKEELNKVNNSNTFKIGKFIMFIPCRIKELITRKK